MTESRWSDYRIDDIGRLVGGATPSTARPEYWNGGIHWTTTKRLGPSYFLYSGEKFISEAGLANSSTTLIPKGNLLVGTRVGVGKISVNTVDVAISQDLTGILVDTTRFDPLFLAFCLSQPEIRGVMLRQARGVTIKGLPREDLRAISFRAPPKAEQQQIASVLVTAQHAIAIEDKLIAAARKLKQSCMQRLFTHGLRGEDQRETVLGMVPAEWEVRELADVAGLSRGRFMHRPRNEPRFYGGSTPFVQTGDVVRSDGLIRDFSQTLNDDGVAISRVFPKGTILITIAANIGYAAVLNFDSACPDSLVAISPSTLLDTWYLEYFLQTQQSEMDRLAPKGTQKNINIQFLSPWPIAVPPVDEQREIAHILRGLDRKISVHVRRRVALESLFSTLLHQLMTGALRASNRARNDER